MNDIMMDLEIYEKKPPGFSSQTQATGCYLEIEGKILLLQYASSKRTAGRWDVPGGRVKEGEMPLNGAIRELFEETGIVIKHSSKMKQILVVYIRKPEIDYIYYLFRVQVDEMPSVHLSSEHQDFIWATSRDLKELPLVDRSQDVLDLYRVALKKRRKFASVNAYLVLRQKDQVLFQLRNNTGYCDGMWSLVAGHVEENESATAALAREANEEIGIDLYASEIKVVHIMHRKSDRFNIDIFFEYSDWEGTIVNCEPEKCAQLEFAPLDNLPSPTIEYISKALQCISEGKTYSEYGWNR